MRCMIGLPQGTWDRGSHRRCARQAMSIRRRRRRCSVWAAHAWDVRSCTISYDIWPPRYRTLDESAIDIAISCNRYDHWIVVVSWPSSEECCPAYAVLMSHCRVPDTGTDLWCRRHWASDAVKGQGHRLSWCQADREQLTSSRHGTCWCDPRYELCCRICHCFCLLF